MTKRKARVKITRDQLLDIFRAMDKINRFMHQPSNFTAPAIGEFMSKNLGLFTGILGLIDMARVNANTARELLSLEISSADLEHIRNLVSLLLNTNQPSPSWMASFAGLVYKPHVHRIYYSVLGPMISDEDAQTALS